MGQSSDLRTIWRFTPLVGVRSCALHISTNIQTCTFYNIAQNRRCSDLTPANAPQQNARQIPPLLAPFGNAPNADLDAKPTGALHNDGATCNGNELPPDFEALVQSSRGSPPSPATVKGLYDFFAFFGLR